MPVLLLLTERAISMKLSWQSSWKSTSGSLSAIVENHDIRPSSGQPLRIKPGNLSAESLICFLRGFFKEVVKIVTSCNGDIIRMGTLSFFRF